MFYRKKPVVIEAIQWSGDNRDEILNFLGEAFRGPIPHNAIEIYTLEGIIPVSVGSYIIKGVRGEFYPCRGDIFEETYEAVRETYEEVSWGD